MGAVNLHFSISWSLNFVYGYLVTGHRVMLESFTCTEVGTQGRSLLLTANSHQLWANKNLFCFKGQQPGTVSRKEFLTKNQRTVVGIREIRICESDFLDTEEFWGFLRTDTVFQDPAYKKKRKHSWSEITYWQKEVRLSCLASTYMNPWWKTQELPGEISKNCI